MFRRCDCSVAGANGKTSVELRSPGTLRHPWTWTEVRLGMDLSRMG